MSYNISNCVIGASGPNAVSYGVVTRNEGGASQRVVKVGRAQNPLATSIAERKKRNVRARDIVRTHSGQADVVALLAALNESGAWKTLLAKRGLLSGTGVAEWVAQLESEWDETRSNNPALTVLHSMCQDVDFADLTLEEFSALLSSLDSDPVAVAAVKVMSFFSGKKEAAQRSDEHIYNTQNKIYTWLKENGIDRDDAKVRIIADRLRAAGVDRLEDLRYIRRDYLLETVRLNPVQAGKFMEAAEK